MSTFVMVAATLLLAGAFVLPSAAAEEPVTLAVLNFSNRNPGDGWDWLEKGLADMLITDLLAADKLRLVTREDMQSLFAEMKLGAAGIVDHESARSFGSIIKADLVLTGSFACKPKGIELEAHIVEVATQKLRRVEWVRGDATDVLKLEKALAMQIVEKLDVPLAPDGRASLLRMATQSVDAARQTYIGIDAADEGRYFDAIACFRLAVGKDASFDKPLLWQGRAYRWAGEFRHAELSYRALTERLPNSRLAPEAAFRRAKLMEKFWGTDLSECVDIYHDVAKRYPNDDYALPAAFRAAVLAYHTDDVKRAGDLAGWAGSMTGRRGVPGWNSMPSVARAIRKRTQSIIAKGLPRRQIPADQSKPAEIMAMPDKRWGSLVKSSLFPRTEDGEVWIRVDAPGDQRLLRLYITPKCEALPENERNGRPAKVRIELYDESAYIRWKVWEPLTSGNENVKFTNCEPGEGIEVPPRSVLLRIIQSGARIQSLALGCNVGQSYVRGTNPRDTRLARGMPGIYVSDETRPDALKRLPGELVSLPAPEAGVFNVRLMRQRNGRLWLVYNDECNVELFTLFGGDADIYLTSSLDGKTWETPLRLPVNSDGHDLQPWLMEDEEGRLRLFWSSQRNGARVFSILTSVSDDGRQWSPPRVCRLPSLADHSRVPSAESQNKYGIVIGVNAPAVVQDEKGVFHLFYLGDPQSYFAQSGRPSMADSNDGFTWRNARKLVLPNGVNYDMSVLYRPGGKYFLCSGTADGTGEQVRLMSSENGGRTWGAMPFPHSGSLPSLGELPDGRLVIAFVTTNRGMRYAVRRADGQWGGYRLLGRNGDILGRPSICIDPAGQAYLSWGSLRAFLMTRRPHILRIKGTLN